MIRSLLLCSFFVLGFFEATLAAQGTIIGEGCSGQMPAAPPIVALSGSTTPGKGASVSLTGAPAFSTAVLMIGNSASEMLDGTPLPLDLGFVDGMAPGCQLYQSTNLLFVLGANALGEVDFGFKVPFGFGPDIYFQWAVLENLEPIALTTSAAVHLDVTFTITPSPKSLTFATTYVGETSSELLILENKSTSTITVEDAVVFDDSASDFAISFGEVFPITLEPGENTIAEVTFTPIGAGLREASIALMHPGVSGGLVNPVIPVSGVGFAAKGDELFIDVASPGFFDSEGVMWVGEFGVAGGFEGSTSTAIAGTNDDGLYQTYRQGPSFSYAVDVPNGLYEVVFHFADVESVVANERIFDVFFEDQAVLVGIDLVAEAGTAAALTVERRQNVTDGVLDLRFTASVGDALLNALEVRTVAPILELAPASIDLGYLSVGTIASTDITLTNVGTETLQLTDVGFLIGPHGGDGTQFTLELNGNAVTGGVGDLVTPLALTLAPEQSAIATLTFDPYAHFSNELELVFDGNFDPAVLDVLAAGGKPGHPFLHVVASPKPALAVDYDGDGVETIKFDGRFSHTHEPGVTISQYEWSDTATGVSLGLGFALTQTLPMGEHDLTLTIDDTNSPTESLGESVVVRVVGPDEVPGALALYYSATSAADALQKLDAVPLAADYVQTRDELFVPAEGATPGALATIGGTGLTGPTMIRLLATVDVEATGTYLIAAVGGLDRRLFVGGEELASGQLVFLTAGLSTIEARFAIASLDDLAVEVLAGVQGTVPMSIASELLVHDETDLLPVIHKMPSAGNSLGGNEIMLEGFAFFPCDDVTVEWGGITLDVDDFDSITPQQICFPAPAMAPSTIDVRVSTPQGTSNVESFTYDDMAPPPIAFTAVSPAEVTDPTSGDWGPDGRFYVSSRFGQLTALTFDDDYNVVTQDTYPGVAGLAPKNEVLGIVFNPFDAPDPVKVYVAHTQLYAQGGGPFSGTSPFPGAVSVLTGPDFDDPVPFITGLPTSNHDHSLNGMQFNDNGDLLATIGSNTNSGVQWPTIGDLPESSLTAAIVKFETSSPTFDGAIKHRSIETGAIVDDQARGDELEIASGDVSVQAAGVRNPYDLVYTIEGRLYATDNGPNSDLGPVSTGPSSSGLEFAAPDELLLIERGNYYGHPNRARGRDDARQNIYRGIDAPAIPEDFTPHVIPLSSSTDGITQYRSQVFGGQMWNDVLVQRWGGQLKRVRFSEDGRTVIQHYDLFDLRSLDVQMGPGGALLGVSYAQDEVRVLVADDITATSMEAFDIHPWRAPPSGGHPFVIGGVNFGSLGNTSVTFGGLPATLTDVRATRIEGLVPKQFAPTTERLAVVVTSAGQSCTLPAAFRFLLNEPGLEPGRWEECTELPVALGQVATARVGADLYAFGGGSTATWTYDLLARYWSSAMAAPRPFAGDQHSAVVIDETIYLVGGRGGGSEGRVQIYDANADTWTLGADLPWAGRAVATVVIDGKIYAAGGFIVGTPLANAAVYDPATDTWTTLPAMPAARADAGRGTDGSRMFLFGGLDSTLQSSQHVQIFDPLTASWSWSGDASDANAPSAMLTPRRSSGRAVYREGEFTLLAGRGLGAAPTPGVAIFDPATNAWRADADIPTPRHGIDPLLFQGLVFVVGGSTIPPDGGSSVHEMYTRQ